MTNPVHTMVQDTADRNFYFVTFLLMASYTKKNNKLFWQTCSQIFPCMRLHRTSLVLSEGVPKCRHLSYARQRREPCVSDTGRAENTHLHSRGMRVQPTRAGRATHS